MGDFSLDYVRQQMVSAGFHAAADGLDRRWPDYSPLQKAMARLAWADRLPRLHGSDEGEIG